MLSYVFVALLAVPSRWPIETLAVEGNRNYSSAEILAVTGLKVGQLAGKPEFEAARDRLVATGRFETVGYRFAPGANSKGYAASFQVIEAGPVYPVQFAGLDVPESELTAWMKEHDPLFGPKLPATTEILDRDARLIRQFLAERKRDVKIVGRVEALTADQFTIVFRPAGAIPTVAELRFQGNQALSTPVLQSAISGTAFGLPYTEQSFQQLLDNGLRPVYEERGYVRVRFPRVTTEPAKNVNGLIVNVQVEEGASYNLGEVKLAGDAARRSGEYLKLAKFKTGEAANFTEINKGIDKITHQFRRDGYLNAAATTERQIDDARKTVNLTVRVTAGPQYVFGKLTVEGLDLNGEAAIRKLWAIKEGKPFNSDYPDFFLKRIREDGVFDQLGETKASVDANDQTHVVSVTLRFAAAPPKPEKKKPY